MNRINYKVVSFIISIICSKIALFMYIPTLYALFTGTAGFVEFSQAVIITHLSAFIMLHFSRGRNLTLGVREMFLITTSAWVIATIFGALPFMFMNHISFTDAYFETMSGITTTGSTVLSGLDQMAPSILLWRSLLQWIGGIGFIVLSVAILPFLNVGGMKLFHTESSDWSEKSAPKTQQVAKKILYTYLILTALCYIGYRLSGMTNFEAINHSMTTLSTGGYSTTDQSMNHFSINAHWVAIVFMFLGGLPFLILIQSLRKNHILDFMKDAQVVGFFRIVIIFALIIALHLYITKEFNIMDAIRIALFNTISVITTTGYGLDDYSNWNQFTSVMFIFLLIIGGCSGSTAGGLKIFRVQIAATLTRKQLLQLIHPSAIVIQRYNNQSVTDEVIRSVVGFITIFALTLIIIASILSLTGLDIITSLSGAMTAIANVGPGLGDVIGPTGNFSGMSNIAKWALSVGMLMGRLELLTVCVLLTPAFWKN